VPGFVKIIYYSKLYFTILSVKFQYALKFLLTRFKSCLIKNKKHLKGALYFLSMGYKKDIFGSFAYEFEPSHK